MALLGCDLTASEPVQPTDVVTVVMIFVLTWYSTHKTSGSLQRKHSVNALEMVRSSGRSVLGYLDKAR